MLTPAAAEAILGKQRRGYRFSPAAFAEYFKDATALLTKKGFCQGAYARSRKGYKLESGKSKHAASFCGIGALERVTPEWREFRVARQLLAQALGVAQDGPTAIQGVNDRGAPDAAKATILGGYAAVSKVLAGLQ